MNFADEPYVRLYTRDTVTWKLMSFQARTVMMFMLRNGFDRSGVLDIGDHDPAKVVAAIAGVPIEFAEIGVPELLENKTWVAEDGRLTWPEYREAQTCRKSNRLRQQEYRDRGSESVTDSNESLHGVTGSNHALPGVTPSLAELSLAEPSLDTPNPLMGEVREVFEHWQTVMVSPRSKLDINRIAHIKRGLKLDFTVDQLKQVATNVSRSDWHMARGEHKARNKCNGVDLLYRNASNIEKYLDLKPEGRQSKPIVPSETQQKANQAAEAGVLAEIHRRREASK